MKLGENKHIFVLAGIVLTVISILILVFGNGRPIQNTPLDTETVESEVLEGEAQESEAQENKIIVSEVVEPENMESQDSIAEMTLEEKIYQMLILMPDQFPEGEISIEKYPVGGILYMQSDLQNPDQTKSMIIGVQKDSIEHTGLPLFICVDEEGGRVARVANNSAFGVTNVGPMADISDAEEAFCSGVIMGTYLSELGFNWDFAPVADVITNPANKVIGDRSFGSKTDVVKDYAISVSKGLQTKGLMTTFKHFPGHGATEGDTHEGFSYSNKTYAELLENELVPFAAAQEAGVDAIMIAHISLPNVTGDNTPCTLSYRVVTEILRNDLGYEGLIITDAMNMGAITKIYSAGESAVKAIEAGCDIILAPTDLKETVNAIKDAVEQERISEARIDESIRRILLAKEKIK